MKFANKLWKDLKTDHERIVFIRCGRATSTGIMAPAIQGDIIELLKFRNEVNKQNSQCQNSGEKI